MTILVSGCIAPMLVAIAVWAWAGHRLTARAPVTRRDEPGSHAPLAVLPAANLWEGLTEEIARRDRRRPARRSGTATRRRHLAAVLPADARR